MCCLFLIISNFSSNQYHKNANKLCKYKVHLCLFILLMKVSFCNVIYREEKYTHFFLGKIVNLMV